MVAAHRSGSTPHGVIIPLDFEPGSLAWCGRARALYVVDVDAARILAWQRARDLVVIALLAGRRGVRPSLGQLAIGRDGDLWAASSPGIIHQLPRSGAHRSWAVDPTRRRSALCVSGDGTVYSAYSLREGTPHCAAIAEVVARGLEVERVAGLTAPVGLVELDGALIVADRARSRLFRVPTARASFFTSFATVDAPTALAHGPPGTLLVGTAHGEVVQLDASGVVVRRVGGLGPVCGLAYDDSGRLFVAENGRLLRILEGLATR